VASLSQGRTAAAQCGLFTYKSVPVIFEPPCITLHEPRTGIIVLQVHFVVLSKMSLRSNRFPIQGALQNLRQTTDALQSETPTMSLNKSQINQVKHRELKALNSVGL